MRSWSRPGRGWVRTRPPPGARPACSRDSALPVARPTLSVCLGVAAKLVRPGPADSPAASHARRPAPPRSLAHVDCGRSGRDHLRDCAGGERVACGGEGAGQGSQLPFCPTLLPLDLVHRECEDTASPQRCGSRKTRGGKAGGAPPSARGRVGGAATPPSRAGPSLCFQPVLGARPGPGVRPLARSGSSPPGSQPPRAGTAAAAAGRGGGPWRPAWGAGP